MRNSVISWGLFFFFLHKTRPRQATAHVIYTWMQVNGVSFTDPSLSDCSDLLFLFMSALVSFFFFFSACLVWALFPSVISLLKGKKKKKAPSFALAVSSFAFLPPPFLTHPHTIFSIGKHQPIQPAVRSGLRGAGWSITWFDGSYYRPGFLGHDAGIFIEADKGSSTTSHPLEEEGNLTQVWFIIIFLPFQGNVKYDLLPPPSRGERHSIVIANLKPGVHLSGMKMSPLIWLKLVWSLPAKKIRTNKRPLLQHAITYLDVCCTRRYKRQWKRLCGVISVNQERSQRIGSMYNHTRKVNYFLSANR